MASSYHLIDLSSSDGVIYISDEEGNISRSVEHDNESEDDETSNREPSTLRFENPNQNITNQNRDAKLEEDIKHAVEKSFIEVKTGLTVFVINNGIPNVLYKVELCYIY